MYNNIMHKLGYVYIITNRNNTVVYIGVTSDLPKRIWEHKNHFYGGFSEKYKLHKLVYYEILDSIDLAIEREKYLKGKTRKFKNALINALNPNWIDLYETIMDK